MPRRIRCVTFDCYGTLIDWGKGLATALGALPALRGKQELIDRLVVRREELEKGLLVSAPELPEEDSPDERFETPEYRPYREILAESVRLAAGELGVAIDEQDGCRIAASMADWEPFPDTCDALRSIARRFPLGILSNVEDEVIEAAIGKLGVRFEIVVTAEKVLSYKPAPDHWYAAMHELEADEEDLFHVAASPFHDLETASLLGVPCAYVNRAGAPLLPEATPEFVVHDLRAAASRLARYTPAAQASPRAHPAADRSGSAGSPTRARARPPERKR